MLADALTVTCSHCLSTLPSGQISVMRSEPPTPADLRILTAGAVAMASAGQRRFRVAHLKRKIAWARRPWQACNVDHDAVNAPVIARVVGKRRHLARQKPLLIRRNCCVILWSDRNVLPVKF